MITAQQAEKLLKGDYTFESLSFSMMLMRMKILYAEDSSPANLQRYTQEISTYLEKFKFNMGSDISTLQKL